MLQYKRVELKTEKDYTKAEKLQAQGWKAILSGFDYILMEKRKGGKMKSLLDLTGAIIEYESGELSGDAILALFAELIKNGQAWSLQGHYGRTASALIEGGYISRSGEILKDLQE